MDGGKITGKKLQFITQEISREISSRFRASFAPFAPSGQYEGKPRKNKRATCQRAMSLRSSQCLIITAPSGAGKSTYQSTNGKLSRSSSFQSVLPLALHAKEKLMDGTIIFFRAKPLRRLKRTTPF